MGVTPTIFILLMYTVSKIIVDPVIISTDSDTTSDSTFQLQEREMNETVTYDGFEFIFTNAYYVDVNEELEEYTIDLYGEPENLLYIDFEYTNQMTYPENPSYYIHFYADNFQIEEYRNMHTIPTADPGQSRQGQLVYEVPDGVETLEVEVGDPNYGGIDRSIVRIVVDE
ncbi:hypothetical protein [Aliicoccus persicus]|uniref:DUF4352 domain-containing protein n=1 Tax=Aliicoccus persicus TaxID=930138 RepID=A0A662Z406_9STAP|nr:hypothetical protein [Aliicoccus persicus]SEV91583.1 hypothetical protein SAMN05192557_0746 [Aliicoccus persicus]